MAISFKLWTYLTLSMTGISTLMPGSNTLKSGEIYCNIKGPAHGKNENLYFLAPAQTKPMKPILMSCEAPFKGQFAKNIGQVVFCKLLQNGALHDIKIGCIRLVWAGRELRNINFYFCYAQAL